MQASSKYAFGGSKRYMVATESDVAVKFSAIKQQIFGALDASVASGKAPAKFVDIVKGFVDEYAT